jgi:hypothetical protein
MSFFAQTGPTAEARLSQQLGQALGQGVAKNFPDPAQLVQQRRLSEAFENVPTNASLKDVLLNAGPALLTTPQGAQFLESYMALQQREAQAKSLMDYYRKGDQALTEKGVATGMPPPEEMTPLEERYKTGREPILPKKEPIFPRRTVSSQPLSQLTPQEIEKQVGEIMIQQQLAGAPADPVAARNTVNMRVQQIDAHNRQIGEETQRRAQQFQNLETRALERAQAADLFTDPEDRTVFQKFYNQTKDFEDPNEAYQFARDKYRSYQDAKIGLLRSQDNPSIVANIARKLMGTYKDWESIIRDIQPQLEVFKEEGLYDEARDILTNELGFGPEQAETALFPISKEEEKLYEKFPPSPIPKTKSDLDLPAQALQKSPQLNAGQFSKFKNELQGLLKIDPTANLIALRGKMVFDKNYAWQDFSKAISQMIDEGEFSPDLIQRTQLNYIKEAPIPGLAQHFKNLWRPGAR